MKLLPIVWLCASGLRAGETIQYATVDKAIIQMRLAAAAKDNSVRLANLHAFFEQSGCNDLMELPVKHSKLPNLSCTLTVESGQVILVGAHFDHVSAGDGVIDNWSGAALLPSLYQSLAKHPRRHTFRFIGFTDEEKGLVGSRDYVEHLDKAERKQISAMINIDSVGTNSTKLELDRGSWPLVNALAIVAQTFQLPLGVVNVHKVGRSDSDSFQDYKIPSLNIHSLTQKTFPLLHTRHDVMSAISQDDYFDTYRLIAAYLAYLDQVLDKPEARGETNAPSTQSASPSK